MNYTYEPNIFTQTYIARFSRPELNIQYKICVLQTLTMYYRRSENNHTTTTTTLSLWNETHTYGHCVVEVKQNLCVGVSDDCVPLIQNKG